MQFLDLCAGIGGFSLGLEWAGMQCAGQVEIDPFCIRALEKHWPDVPRWNDVKDIDNIVRIWGPHDSDSQEGESGIHADRAIDLVCGGYP